ncbi:MAG: hypothetical protein ACREAG_02265 [Nitrosopumilaceae archaeon]
MKTIDWFIMSAIMLAMIAVAVSNQTAVPQILQSFADFFTFFVKKMSVSSMSTIETGRVN